MRSRDGNLQGTEAAVTSVPDWLRDLIRAFRSQGLQPKVQRVRSLWNLLRQRGLLSRSRRVRVLLLYAWRNGLRPRPRPRTTRRLVRQLRRWGILPGLTVSRVAPRPVRIRALRPIVVQPLRPQY